MQYCIYYIFRKIQIGIKLHMIYLKSSVIVGQRGRVIDWTMLFHNLWLRMTLFYILVLCVEAHKSASRRSALFIPLLPCASFPVAPAQEARSWTEWRYMFQSSMSYTKIIRASLFVNIPASPLLIMLSPTGNQCKCHNVL